MKFKTNVNVEEIDVPSIYECVSSSSSHTFESQSLSDEEEQQRLKEQKEAQIKIQKRKI